MKTKMRIKYLTSIALLLFVSCQQGFGQTEKGRFALSGKTDANFLFSKTKIGTDSIQTGRQKNTQYAFTLGAGYFVADNLNIGISGTYSYTYSKTDPSDVYYGNENIVSSYSVIPQINYFLPVAGNLKPFIGVGAGYLWVQERDSRITDNNNLYYSLSGLSLNGMAGLSYFFNEQICADVQAQFTRNRLKDKLRTEQIQTENALGATIGITLFF